MFGYDRVYDEESKKNKFVKNEQEANEIRCIYNWYLNGINGDKTKCSIKDITFECIAQGFSPYLTKKRNVTKCLGEKAYTGYKN